MHIDLYCRAWIQHRYFNVHLSGLDTHICVTPCFAVSVAIWSCNAWSRSAISDNVPSASIHMDHTVEVTDHDKWPAIYHISTVHEINPLSTIIRRVTVVRGVMQTISTRQSEMANTSPATCQCLATFIPLKSKMLIFFRDVISLLARVIILLIDTATQEVPMNNIWKKLSVQLLRYAIELLHVKRRTPGENNTSQPPPGAR